MCSRNRTFNKLKCPRAYLVKTGHRIVGITDSTLSIIGTVYLRIHRGGRLSNQMVHISENLWEFYLSQTAIKDLGIINQSFPNSQTAAVNFEGEYNCPKRINTPTRPKQIPFESTTKNIPKLKSWLLDAFSSSAFNQCPHQALLSITGEPVKLHFKEGATPYAVHTPIPIPHHWKHQVKDDLDHGEHLHIIEEVPQDTTLKWCVKMVVTPRRTVTPDALSTYKSSTTPHSMRHITHLAL